LSALAQGRIVHHAELAVAGAYVQLLFVALCRKDLKREFDSFLQKVGVKK
jgi:hypothetical protein